MQYRVDNPILQLIAFPDYYISFQLMNSVFNKATKNDQYKLLESASVENFLTSMTEINLASPTLQTELTRDRSPAALSMEEGEAAHKECDGTDINAVCNAAQVDKLVTMAHKAAARRMAVILGLTENIDSLLESWRFIVEVSSPMSLLLSIRPLTTLIMHFVIRPLLHDQL